ncbi:MAG: mannose-1-phosphate guanylyltransferase [Chromatiales bacterium]|jgi:MurNAc alpha-1-phosphate uridylyltransferase|nr:mannose-1-phosphate guanylyltransferase [Chromatiales bacterium]HJP03462.1 nucleotidyltransferase family protein [Gammaproteobacteria bacterium]
MKAMILAAGRGERMRPLTDTTPKALLKVGGRALIEYHIEALKAAGVVDIVVNLAWLGEQIVDYLGDGGHLGVKIVYSDEGVAALETGGGIFRALKVLGDEPFWVVNGDTHTSFTYSQPQPAGDSLAHLILVPNPEHNPGGDFVLAGDRVQNSGGAAYTYSGIGVFSAGLFMGQTDGVFPLAPLLRKAADDNCLTGELFEGLWSDVGTPERLKEVDKLIGKSSAGTMRR